MSRLPFSLKILLENLLRNEDGLTVTADDIRGLAAWDPKAVPSREIAFRPSRVLLQDFTGVPAVVDLAAMRDAMKRMGGDPRKINPLQPVELVIDHSVQVDEAGTRAGVPDQRRPRIQPQPRAVRLPPLGSGRVQELPGRSPRYRDRPPGEPRIPRPGRLHLDRHRRRTPPDETPLAYPDTLVGTDSHTTMINGLGVLGWGVGGIEAEAAMLGQPVSMLVPQVVGFKLTGRCREGATATDLVLTVTEMLRRKGVVGKFVEFYGDGLANLPLADRATIANMAPEYGATCGIFPIDAETLRYLELSGRPRRPDPRWSRPTARRKGCSTRRAAPEAEYSDTLELDLSTVEPSLAGPKRPQDRVPLHDAKDVVAEGAQGDARRPADARQADAAATTTTSRASRLEGEGGGGTAVGVEDPHARRGHVSPAPHRLHRPRLGRHRRDHQLHQHVEPLGHGRRRPAGQEGRRARPDDQALGQGEPRPRLEGRDRLPQGRRARPRTSTSSGSTSSATAARPASATRGRSR